jgi:hypothetical protein
VKAALRKDLMDQKAYYDYMRTEKGDFYNTVAREAEINEFMLQLVDGIEKQYNPAAGAPVRENPKQAADSATNK